MSLPGLGGTRTATLADSFLADMESSDEEAEGSEDEEGSSEEEEEGEDGDKKLVKQEPKDEMAIPDIEINELDFDAMSDEDEDEDSDGGAAGVGGGATVKAISRLLGTSELQDHIAKVKALMSKTEQEDGTHANVDRDEEYSTIVKSNELATQIDSEIIVIHKFIRDLYATKFPELEQLVQNPLEYAQVVKVIGNVADVSEVESKLGDYIPAHTILTVSVTATTTTGQPLPESELRKVIEACDGIVLLDTCKKDIYEYVESRMHFIAPNVSAIVGTDIAARLVAKAGGLTELSKIPSCNLQVLGTQQKNLAGFSTQSKDLHMGLLARCPLLAHCPADIKNRTLRLVAGKVTLAARIDSFHQDSTGATGEKYYEAIAKKVAKWQEPPPPKLQKALPKPNDTPRRKRGGKRYRKKRERFMQTELNKQKNRMSFLEAEQTDDYTGEGMGMLGRSGSGQLTVKKEDKQKLKSHLSRKVRARLQRVQSSGAATGTTTGMASSIAFTPVQGIELVAAPDAQSKLAAMNNKYFSSSGTFFKVNKKRKLEEERQRKVKEEDAKRAKAAAKGEGEGEGAEGGVKLETGSSKE